MLKTKIMIIEKRWHSHLFRVNKFIFYYSTFFTPLIIRTRTTPNTALAHRSKTA